MPGVQLLSLPVHKRIMHTGKTCLPERKRVTQKSLQTGTTIRNPQKNSMPQVQATRARRSGVDRHVCNVKATGSNPVESILILPFFSMTEGYDGFEGQRPRDLTGSNPARVHSHFTFVLHDRRLCRVRLYSGLVPREGKAGSRGKPRVSVPGIIRSGRCPISQDGRFGSHTKCTHVTPYMAPARGEPDDRRKFCKDLPNHEII